MRTTFRVLPPRGLDEYFTEVAGEQYVISYRCNLCGNCVTEKYGAGGEVMIFDPRMEHLLLHMFEIVQEISWAKE